MPMAGMHLPARGGWRIYVSDALSPSHQLRAAVHQLKHLIDHPVRTGSRPGGFSDGYFEILADHFADLVLGERGP
jgi:hypothetical protein